MLKLRFRYNQIGMWLESWKGGEWCSASVTFKPEHHGGIANLKSKILLQITDRYELVPPGDYQDEPGYTVTCV